MEGRGRSRHSRGFTLIELVAAIVIVGVVTAVAVPVFRDLRYDARKAALEGIRATLIANMNAARTAYLAQGLGPGDTVRVNGKSIPVYGEGAVDIWGYQLPPGSPTGAGMYLMLGCGLTAPVEQTDLPCPGLPGYTAWVQDSWIDVAAVRDGTTNCYVAYYAPYGFDPGYVGEGTWGNVWTLWGQGSEIGYYPAAQGYTNGC